jgi:nitroreductase
MDVVEAIKGRKSVRAFESRKDVSEKTVEELIDAARGRLRLETFSRGSS